jgi:transcriptional regulator with XRE-family HTH domain
MTPTERGELQRAILNGARSVPSGKPTQAKVASVMGFDRTEYGRFEAGLRKLDLDEIVAACEDPELGGPLAILAPLCERFGLRVEPMEAAPSVDKLGASVRLVREAADVPPAVIALAGAGSPEALEKAIRELDETIAVAEELRASLVRARRVA